MKNFKNILISAVVLLVIAGLFWAGRGTSEFKTITVENPETLSGIQKGTLPWTSGTNDLRKRLTEIGFPVLSTEGQAMHIHQNLDIYINGKQIAIPTGIGIGPANSLFSPIHVHDEPGIIHVESPVKMDFTLGNFFDVWGVKLTPDCIGGYCVNDTMKIKVYSNGKLQDGNPRDLKLQSRQKIVITYGTDEEAPKEIPSTYAFPRGY